MNSVTASIPAKVLLVDDEDQQVELRAYVLRTTGYSVFTATDPLQALTLARRIEGLDVAILDYEMPTMNGGLLARQFKANFPKLIVILYSAAVGIPSRALDMVDAFIPKGENVTALLQYLATVSADATDIDIILKPQPRMTTQNRLRNSAAQSSVCCRPYSAQPTQSNEIRPRTFTYF